MIWYDVENNMGDTTMIDIRKPRVITEHTVLIGEKNAGRFSLVKDEIRYMPQGAHDLCDGFTVSDIKTLLLSMEEAAIRFNAK